MLNDLCFSIRGTFVLNSILRKKKRERVWKLVLRHLWKSPFIVLTIVIIVIVAWNWILVHNSAPFENKGGFQSLKFKCRFISNMLIFKLRFLMLNRFWCSFTNPHTNSYFHLRDIYDLCIGIKSKGYAATNIYPMIFLLYLLSWMTCSLLTSTCQFKYAHRPLNQRSDKSKSKFTQT